MGCQCSLSMIPPLAIAATGNDGKRRFFDRFPFVSIWYLADRSEALSLLQVGVRPPDLTLAVTECEKNPALDAGYDMSTGADM